jgi:hypothetical protein
MIKEWHNFARDTGYDYPDLPGLGNNNEKLGLPERLSTGIQFRFRNLFHGKKSGNPSILRFPYELHVLITYKYRQIKFRMNVYNKIGTYENKSTTTINKI